jgi:hypothetical protein
MISIQQGAPTGGTGGISFASVDMFAIQEKCGLQRKRRIARVDDVGELWHIGTRQQPPYILSPAPSTQANATSKPGNHHFLTHY